MGLLQWKVIRFQVISTELFCVDMSLFVGVDSDLTSGADKSFVDHPHRQVNQGY